MSKTVDRESLYLALSAAGVALSACSLASVYLKPRRRYAEEVIGPDVEYVLSRAQAIQQENSSPVLTVDHLNSALEKVQGGGGGGGGGGDQLTKAELEATMKQMLMPPGGVMDGESVLDKFTNDLTAAARRGQLDPLVGRDGELRRLCHILLRRTKNNPVLVGEPGVGKTAIVEGLAQRIMAGDVPPGLLGASLLELDLASLAAGCMMPGEFEERLKAVCVEVAESSRNIILFIDDIHNLVPNAAQQGASMLDGSAILKPALARGTLRCLGCSSPDKFKKTIEKDPGLERRFQQVAVDPPNVEQATSILRGLRPRYERHHGVTISEAALLAAAQLSARYISGRHLPDKAIDCLDEAAAQAPDKAIDCLDEAAAQVKMEAGSAPEALDALNRKITTLQTELGQLASRAGEDSGDSSSGGSSFMASMARARGSAEKDATAAKCAQAVRLQLAELQEQQAVLAAEVAAEKEAEQELQDLRNNVLRLRFEVDYASRMDGRPDAPGEDAAASLAEKQEQLAEAQAAVQAAESTSAGKHLRSQTVTEHDITRVISKWTGIPISKLVSSERERLLGLADELHKRIIGQEDAVNAVATAVQRSRADLSDPNGPIASFMFLGPTGVGKTELAKALAAFLFNTEDAMVRLDMSEYMEKHSVSRLIGTPPGYVGYEEGGLLSDAVKRRPYSIVLLDEVEKAHADVFNVLLQILDDGRVTDNQGHTVSFKNCVIIMTSNLGSAQIFEHLPSDSREDLKARVMAEVKAHFRPEFVNRVDEFIVFEPLVRSQIRDIVGLRATALVQRVAAQHIRMALGDSAVDFLAAKGFDPVFGARPVKRALQRELQTLLAQALLRGEFVEGDTILVEAAPDGSCLTLRKGDSSSTRQQLQLPRKPQLTDGRPPAAAAVNGDAAGDAAAAVPPGKKKVIRLVKKKSSNANGAVNGSANGSPANGKAANGQSMSRSSSSGGLQSVPLPSFDSDAE
ncbi:hypothetical protein OEZ86_012610 [Tetradesmus obliquus]|nr:hypothetical protein OEZ86_012610 [Tetradesmus obliquus]